MKHILTIIFLLALMGADAQPVEVSLFQKEATATTAKMGVRIRATGAPIDFIGVSFYILYQSTQAAPQSSGQNTVVGVDDSKLVTTFGWGVGARNTNPALAVNVDPGAPGGKVYDRMFIYGCSDETGGSNVRSITSQWDTLLYITLTTLQPVYPQGGYAYMLATSENLGAALSDINFVQFPFSVNGSGDLPLGLSALPVSFSKFDANCTNSGTMISWSTAQESNSSRFEIERSSNGNNWKTIATVAAAGSSGAARNYQQLDLDGGKAFYRIKQVDNDGQATYTSIESTNCQVKNVSTLLYPVPASNVLNVVIRSDKNVRTQLMVYDMQGKLVRKQDASVQNGSNTFKIDLSGLSSGDYMLRTNDNVVELNKIFTISR